jgi:hypothetical protein
VDGGITRRLRPLPRCSLPLSRRRDGALSRAIARLSPSSTTPSRAAPFPGEKGDVDGGITRHLRPLPRGFFLSPAGATVPSLGPSRRPLPPARLHRVLPPSPARKGMWMAGSPAVCIPFLAAPFLSPAGAMVPCPGPSRGSFPPAQRHRVLPPSPVRKGTWMAGDPAICVPFLTAVLSRRRDGALSRAIARRSPSSTTPSRAAPFTGEKGDVDGGITRRLRPLPRGFFPLPPARWCPVQGHRAALSLQHDAFACCPLHRRERGRGWWDHPPSASPSSRLLSSPAGATVPSPGPSRRPLPPARRHRVVSPGTGKKGDVDSRVTRCLRPIPRHPLTLPRWRDDASPGPLCHPLPPAQWRQLLLSLTHR